MQQRTSQFDSRLEGEREREETHVVQNGEKFVCFLDDKGCPVVDAVELAIQDDRDESGAALKSRNREKLDNPTDSLGEEQIQHGEKKGKGRLTFSARRT